MRNFLARFAVWIATALAPPPKPKPIRVRRDERGSMNILASVVVVIALIVGLNIASNSFGLGLDPLGWLAAAVDWTQSVVTDIFNGPDNGGGGRGNQ